MTTERRKTGTHINNVIPATLGKELLKVKNGNRNYFFISGEATPKGAVSTFDKQYRKAFTKAGIKVDGQLSHTLRYTFAVELLKAGLDIHKVQPGAWSFECGHHRELLREVESGTAGHPGRGPRVRMVIVTDVIFGFVDS